MAEDVPMNLSYHSHSIDQCRKRSLPFEAVYVICRQKLDSVKRRDLARIDVAVKIFAWDHVRGDEETVGSAGDELWAIVRKGMMMTVMYRYSRQAKTPEAFGVDLVIQKVQKG